MLRIIADNHNPSMALDYLALLAYFLYGRLNFHFILPFPYYAAQSRFVRAY
jgi:hypothetical protein